MLCCGDIPSIRLTIFRAPTRPPAVQIGIPVEVARSIKLKSANKRCHVPLYFFRAAEQLAFNNIHAHYSAHVVELANVAAQVSRGERLTDKTNASVHRLFTGQWHRSTRRTVERSSTLPNLIQCPPKNKNRGNTGMGGIVGMGGGSGDGGAAGGVADTNRRRRPSRSGGSSPTLPPSRAMEFIATFEISVEVRRALEATPPRRSKQLCCKMSATLPQLRHTKRGRKAGWLAWRMHLARHILAM